MRFERWRVTFRKGECGTIKGSGQQLAISGQARGSFPYANNPSSLQRMVENRDGDEVYEADR